MRDPFSSSKVKLLIIAHAALTERDHPLPSSAVQRSPQSAISANALNIKPRLSCQAVLRYKAETGSAGAGCRRAVLRTKHSINRTDKQINNSRENWFCDVAQYSTLHQNYFTARGIFNGNAMPSWILVEFGRPSTRDTLIAIVIIMTTFCFAVAVAASNRGRKGLVSYPVADRLVLDPRSSVDGVPEPKAGANVACGVGARGEPRGPPRDQRQGSLDVQTARWLISLLAYSSPKTFALGFP